MKFKLEFCTLILSHLPGLQLLGRRKSPDALFLCSVFLFALIMSHLSIWEWVIHHYVLCDPSCFRKADVDKQEHPMKWKSIYFFLTQGARRCSWMLMHSAVAAAYSLLLHIPALLSPPPLSVTLFIPILRALSHLPTISSSHHSPLYPFLSP